MLKPIIGDGDIELFLSNTGKTTFPDGIATKINTEIMGKRLSLVELGIESKGIPPIIRRLIKILPEILQGKVSIKDILEPFTSETGSSVSVINNIMKKVRA